MSDEDPHWPLRLAFRIFWFAVCLPTAVGLLWLLTRIHLPAFLDRSFVAMIVGATLGSASIIFRRPRRREATITRSSHSNAQP